jgi:Concanavalin A-like lectin/glucanases superfamily
VGFADMKIHSRSFMRTILVLGLGLLNACSGGSGGGGSDREVSASGSTSSGFVYSGPAPSTEEIQSFMVSFYEPLAGDDRCGGCHTPGKTGTPAFVNQSNVNQAWQHARRLVNLNDPAASSVVTRVANGHNCWLAPTQAATCAATIVGYIERWAEAAGDGVATVNLTPRTPYSPGSTRVLPPGYTDVIDLGLDLTSGGELLDLLQTNCVDCHSDASSIPQVPYLASADVDIAYAALRGKVDLTTPSRSRLVQRMSPESHNCWTDCDSDANTLEAAIASLSAVVTPTEVDPGLLISTAQVLGDDGIEADTGGRSDGSIIAKWEFKEGTGSTAADTSGVRPEIPLTLTGEYSWLAGWGIRLVNGKAQGGASASAKLFDLIRDTGEYSIEAWIAPANVSQEEAWIVGYAGGPNSRNLLLSQSLYNYQAFNRSSVTDDNSAGEPGLSTDDDAQLAQATLQHVVVTFDPIQGRRIYVNGVYSGDEDPAGGGLINSWNESFAVVLGNTTSNNNPWEGTLRMVAVHNTALTDNQIVQNYEVGVGQKFYLMFSVSEVLDFPGTCHVTNGAERTNYCYVVFQVSQFDESSYLFDTPFFVNINPDGGNVEFDLEGIHLGINGKLARVGQGFVNVTSEVSSQASGVTQSLVDLGSVIPLENGADQDVFFLAFDTLYGQMGIRDEQPRLPYQLTLNGEDAPDIGMRTFDAINATLSTLTGVPTGSSNVSPVTGKTVGETFSQIRRALPGVADFNAFLSSHLMAATQLTAAYCDALVQDTALRETLFPPAAVFNFNRPVGDAGIDWRNHVVAPLVDRAINTGLVAPVDRTSIIDEVELLITDDRDLKPYVYVNGAWVTDPDPASHNKRDGLIYCENDATCPSSRTADVVKAACTSVFGSAVVLLH